jgi:nucleotide-binding universal stress UspA family protein
MRVLLLIDGLHTKELLGSLAQLVRLGESELLLVYVRGPASRTSLGMVTHRPGRQEIAPHRALEVSRAEQERAAAALAEAAALAGPLAAAVDSMEKEGEAGRVVCEVATAWRADLVAVRSRGRDRPPGGKATLGPAAHYIADHAPCPVLLLHGDR